MQSLLVLFISKGKTINCIKFVLMSTFSFCHHFCRKGKNVAKIQFNLVCGPALKRWFTKISLRLGFFLLNFQIKFAIITCFVIPTQEESHQDLPFFNIGHRSSDFRLSKINMTNVIF
ncbi:MAG: hypothetical protein CVU08_15305 [Bacteroidetes bacterium HGW-Bacteroidetes-3]|nr:MAG: hypothetical protein CVU08_15305 [Bacteroidetes bacterium HGW-Bacteroidetes-3]